jgi:glycosyltransferase involved in cell wall biosynthesis
MKINLIIPSFYPAIVYGGPIFSTLNTCKELAKLEDVDIYVSTTNANMGSRLDLKANQSIEIESGLNVKYYNETVVGKFSLALFFNVWRDIKNSDVVHVQAIFNSPVPISLFLARILSKPTLLTPRGSLGSWVMGQGSVFKRLWLWLFIRPFSNYVVWHVTAEQERLEVLHHYPSAKVEIISNGIFIDEYTKVNTISKNDYIQKFTNSTSINVNKIVISMGRLQKKKGFDILIDSFSHVIEKFPNSYLLIAGPDEGEKIDLENKILELGLQDFVYLIGSIESQDKVDFLANADIFVLPSHNENFGNVYLESLAAGTPIIASKGTPWGSIEDYNCGYWVENSIICTSTAMINLLEKDRELMKNNSVKLAQGYDWSSIAMQFYKLFTKIV